MKFKALLPAALILLALAAFALAADYRGQVLVPKGSTSQAVWYINPIDAKRYYAGKSSEVEALAGAFGVKASDKTVAGWKKSGVPKAYAGRFAYVLAADGRIAKLYYVTAKLKLVDLGQPADYFNKLRVQALVVDIKVLAAINSEYNLPASKLPRPVVPVAAIKPAPVVSGQAYDFSWPYLGKTYNLNLNLSPNVDSQYGASEKYFVYTGTRPANWQETYYAMFLKPKSGDSTIANLADQLQDLAAQNYLTEDQTLELAVNFVQSIPYDTAKSNNIAKALPNYPYETLYRRLGICTDKSLLMIAILRQLGYGAALINYPDVNHASAGVLCPSGYDFRSTGYCYIETTSFFPIGAYPQNFSANGIVANKTIGDFKGQFDKIFDSSPLGGFSILEQTKGKQYKGAAETRAKVEKMQALEKSMSERSVQIASQRTALDSAGNQLQALQARMLALKGSGDNAGYNALVPQYNAQADAYNNQQNNLKSAIGLYNSDVGLYNQLLKNFYSVK